MEKMLKKWHVSDEARVFRTPKAQKKHKAEWRRIFLQFSLSTFHNFSYGEFPSGLENSRMGKKPREFPKISFSITQNIFWISQNEEREKIKIKRETIE